jgi:hypothetical protein
MYVKASIAVPAQAFPGESAWKLRITYSNKGSQSHISPEKRRSMPRYDAPRLLKAGRHIGTDRAIPRNSPVNYSFTSFRPEGEMVFLEYCFLNWQALKAGVVFLDQDSRLRSRRGTRIPIQW